MVDDGLTGGLNYFRLSVRILILTRLTTYILTNSLKKVIGYGASKQQKKMDSVFSILGVGGNDVAETMCCI